MKVTLESTTKIVELEGAGPGTVPARIWEGETDTGIPVHVFVTRIRVAADQDCQQFEKEVQECRAPCPKVDAIPLRLIL